MTGMVEGVAVQTKGKSISTEPESVQVSVLSYAGGEVTMMTVEELYTGTLVSCPVQTSTHRYSAACLGPNQIPS